MEYLEISDGHGKKRHIRLDQPRFLIGRESTCDICLPHPSVSRRHAQLQRTDEGAWLLQDLNSLNHVYAKENPVQQIVLEPGKQVRISEFRLMLRETTPAPELPPPTPSTDELSPSWPGLEPGWMEQLQQFQRSLLRQELPRGLLDKLAEQFQRVAKPQVVAVGLSEPEGYRWEVVCTDNSQAPVNGSLEVAVERASGAEDSEIQSWHDNCPKGETPTPTAAFCMLFPMKGRAGIIGHVFVQRPNPMPMPPALQRYLSLYANYAGLLWENLQVIALRSSQRALEAELSQARQIQVELFPPTFDVDPRLSAFAVNLPSVRVSGDYYDLVRIGPDTIAFVIADAMGHGMPAALMMASVRATLRMGLTLGLTYEALFRGVDSIISQAKVMSFVTGVVGQVDLAKRELTLAIAGHQPPSVLVNGALMKTPDDCQTRPWGIDFESEWKVGRVSLGEGEWSILCFTDGVTDALIGPHQTYGVSRVLEFHKSHQGRSAEDLCQGLLSDLASKAQTVSLADDQTVLALRSALPCN